MLSKLTIKEVVSKHTGVLVEANGYTTFIEPKNKNEWSLKELQQAVKGLIEIYPIKPFDNGLIICNEEGLIYDLPLNEPMLQIYGVKVFGDVIIILDKMLK